MQRQHFEDPAGHVVVGVVVTADGKKHQLDAEGSAELESAPVAVISDRKVIWGTYDSN